MQWMKRLEQLAKTILAYLAAALLFRPGRRSKAARRAGSARRVLLVRIDNRVGEALLMTPLLDALAQGGLEVTVLLHPRCVRVLEGHRSGARLLALDRRGLALGPLAPGIRAVRQDRYDAVVDCSNWTAPSVTSAIVSRLVARDAAVIGPLRAPVSALQDVSVRARADTRDEVRQRMHLLSPLAPHPEVRALSFRTPKPNAAAEAVLTELGGRPFAVVNPGGRLGVRRVPPEAFIQAARTLTELGRSPVITWGPGEESLANQVVSAVPGATLAPPTDLDGLAFLMERAGLTVCNNTGPMHLSVAVGAPTLALFLRIEMERWGHAFAPHRMLDVTPAVDAPKSADALTKAVDDAVRAFCRTVEPAATRATSAHD